jgi:hypothetical protein
MSRRNLSQPSFVDAMVIEQAFSKASNADQSNTVRIVLL